MEEIPYLSDHLRRRLDLIEPSKDGHLMYYPVRVRLRSGEYEDHVYVVDADQYIRVWGVWPWQDRGKRYLPLTAIEDLEESPQRLPPSLANKLYETGESGMGYYAFTLVLHDGQTVDCITGDAVDFPYLPPGVTREDIADVRAQDGPYRASAGRARGYSWSLFRGSLGSLCTS